VQLEYIVGQYTGDPQNPTKIHLHLPALEDLSLWNLPSLVGLCPKQYHTTLPRLKYLSLKECLQFNIKSFADFITHHSVTRSVDNTIIKVYIPNSIFSYYMHVFISHSFIVGIEWECGSFSRFGDTGGKQ
jgi:hypothetical protein